MYRQAVFFSVEGKQFISVYSFWKTSSWRLPPSSATHCLKQFTKLSKLRRNISWFMIAISSQTGRFISSIVCGAVPVYPFLKYPHRKKSGTVRFGDPSGHGVPDAWKCSSSLTKTLHTQPIHCRWTGFEMAWHISFCVCGLCPRLSLIEQKCVQQFLSRLCAALYIGVSAPSATVFLYTCTQRGGVWLLLMLYIIQGQIWNLSEGWLSLTRLLPFPLDLQLSWLLRINHDLCILRP